MTNLLPFQYLNGPDYPMCAGSSGRQPILMFLGNNLGSVRWLVCESESDWMRAVVLYGGESSQVRMALGGFSSKARRAWFFKSLRKAKRCFDGICSERKIYIDKLKSEYYNDFVVTKPKVSHEQVRQGIRDNTSA